MDATAGQKLLKAIEEMERQLAEFKLQLIGETEVGVIGVYEGDYMVTAEGQRYEVPANYASKTMLVSGDTLRMVQPGDGQRARYKQIGKVERAKALGMLVKKDGKYEVLTEAGSFRVLTAAVEHYGLEVGDTAVVRYPMDFVRGSWAAIEKPAASGVGTTSSGQTQDVTQGLVGLSSKPEPALSQPDNEVAQPTSASQTMPTVAPSLLEREKVRVISVGEVEKSQTGQQSEGQKGKERSSGEGGDSENKSTSGSRGKNESKNDSRAGRESGGDRKKKRKKPAEGDSKKTERGSESRSSGKPASGGAANKSDRRESKSSSAERQAMPATSGEIVPEPFDEDDLL